MMGVCIGSLMCENNTCPKLLTEGVCTQMNFQGIVEPMFVSHAVTLLLKDTVESKNSLNMTEVRN